MQKIDYYHSMSTVSFDRSDFVVDLSLFFVLVVDLPILLSVFVLRSFSFIQRVT